MSVCPDVKESAPCCHVLYLFCLSCHLPHLFYHLSCCMNIFFNESSWSIYARLSTASFLDTNLAFEEHVLKIVGKAFMIPADIYGTEIHAYYYAFWNYRLALLEQRSWHIVIDY